MTDADAARISKIAVEFGIRFRSEIDQARADGINMETDTTHSDILADESRTRRFLKEIEERDVVPASGSLRPSVISYARANYFSLLLDKYLLSMLNKLSERIMGSRFSFIVDDKIFDFALAQFAKSADLSYSGGITYILREDNIRTTHRFKETYWPLRPDKLWWIEVDVKYAQSTETITLARVLFRARDAKSLFRVPRPEFSGKCPQTNSSK